MLSSGREGSGGGALEALLADRPVTHVRWGLERIRAVLEGLEGPQDAFASVHIGGTNGKGSTAVAAASILRAAGLRTGLYTSPHLVDVRERILVDGRPLPADLLDACAARVRPLADREEATHFEAITAVAFLAFAEAGVEWAAVEAGVGGRLDATNALLPASVAITGIARDHEDWLGEGPLAIAAEKAGILKRRVPAVLGPMSPRVRGVFVRRAAALGAPLLRLGRDARPEEVAVDLDGTAFRYRSAVRPGGLRVRIPMPGRHQAWNAALAVLALEQVDAAPTDLAVRSGLASARLPGRFQAVRRSDVLWVLDIAHNPAAVRALLDTARRVAAPLPRVALVAILRDKPWEEMLRRLAAAVPHLILTLSPSSPASRRWDPERAAAALTGGVEGGEGEDGRGRAEVTCEPDFDRALGRARELAAGGTVLVTGSAYTVGDALRRLGAVEEGAHAPPGPRA